MFLKKNALFVIIFLLIKFVYQYLKKKRFLLFTLRGNSR